MNRKTGVLLSYALMIFEVLSTLLLTPFIIRSLGQAEYGVYKLTASVAVYLLLLDMGVGNAIVRYVAKYHATGETELEQRFLGVAQIYYLLIAIAAGICGLGLVALFPHMFAIGLTAAEIRLGQILLAIISLNTVIMLATAPFPYIITGRGQFAITRGASILQIIVRMTLTYAALKLGFKSIIIVTINLLTTLLCRGGLGLYVLLKLKLKPVLSGVNKEFIKEIAGYSTWILLQMIATQINAAADQVLLGILVPGAALVIAVYGVGAQISQYFQSIGSAFGGVLMPGVVKMVETGADPYSLQIEMVRIGRIIMLSLAAILGGFILYGKQFIALWAGAQYIDGYYVALLLMIAHAFILTESIGTQILWAKNEHKEQAILKLLIVVVNVGLTILLIRWKPLIGATLGTFISLLLGDVVVMNLVFKKKIGISLQGYYTNLFRGILPTFLLTVLLNSFFSMLQLSGWIGLGCNIAVYCATYCTLAVTIGMNDDEKQMVFGILKSLSLLIRKKQTGD